MVPGPHCPTSSKNAVTAYWKIGWCLIWLEDQMTWKVILQLWVLPLLQHVSMHCTNNGTMIRKNALCSCIWNVYRTLGLFHTDIRIIATLETHH
jgi:hypothetical protein